MAQPNDYRKETAMFSEVRQDGRCGAQLVARVTLRKGTIIASFQGAEVVASPSWTSLQIGDGQHLEDIGTIRYVNHSCSPNLYFDAGSLEVEVLRDVEAGEELTLFYPSSEWEMSRPFECCCGSDACLGLISGAKNIGQDVLAGRRINRHISDRWANSPDSRETRRAVG
jgi:hypothetical protein